MEILLLILIILLGILLFLYLQLQSELSSMYEQLHYTRKENSTFTFFTNSNNANVERIIHEMNLMKNEMQKEKHHHLKNEKDVQDMIANISHDIRTPLTSIQGYLEMMQHSDIEDETRYYEIVQQRLHDLESMLDEFFLYTKLMSLNDAYELQSMELYPLLCRCLLSYRDILTSHDLEPYICCADESIKACIHEESLKRLCMNLIMNTIRYGKKPFQITLKEEGNAVLLIFSNRLEHSIDVEHMFDRFYKGDEARTQKGSGLGLAIVKELSEHMHGHVSAEIEQDMLHICVTLTSK